MIQEIEITSVIYQNCALASVANPYPFIFSYGAIIIHLKIAWLVPRWLNLGAQDHLLSGLIVRVVKKPTLHVDEI